MGLDCVLRDTTLAKHGIGPIQGALFCHFDYRNPSALIRTKARLLCAPELDQFRRR
jgi:hypothetical protein